MANIKAIGPNRDLPLVLIAIARPQEEARKPNFDKSNTCYSITPTLFVTARGLC